MRVLVIENCLPNESPWWLQHVPKESKCTLDIRGVPETRQKPVVVLLKLFRLYLKRNKYDAIVTQQDGYATFLFASLNRIPGAKRHRHIVHEFMSREADRTLYSRMKWRFLRFAMRSVDDINCSSRAEIDYYKQQLRLPPERFHFIPLSTNPAFLNIPTSLGDYIVTAGRTGRDYATFVEAVRSLPLDVYLVASPRNVEGLKLPENVITRFDIPMSELNSLIAGSRCVVVPLQDKPISVGQSVILQAMAMGKAVIATRIGAVEDYITDGETGTLVPAGDAGAMRQAIEELCRRSDLAETLGVKARVKVRKEHLPYLNVSRICNIL